MKAFDKWPDATVSPDTEFNERVAKADEKIFDMQEEHDTTNHRLQIEMRNKPAAHFMRVEIPQRRSRSLHSLMRMHLTSRVFLQD